MTAPQFGSLVTELSAALNAAEAKIDPAETLRRLDELNATEARTA